MRPDDLAAVSHLAAEIHPAYPEADTVFADRLRLFPAGCFLATDPGGSAAGYALAHPGRFGAPPALNSRMAALPAEADCLYLHDIALTTAARGFGLGADLLARLRAIAATHGLPRIALVAVGGSAPYWRRLGFRPPEAYPPDLAAKLASYGGDADYLVG